MARDDRGKPSTVRYDAVNAMLLNEFLKQRRKVEALEETVEQLKIALREQAAEIQQVSERLEMNRSTPRVGTFPSPVCSKCWIEVWNKILDGIAPTGYYRAAFQPKEHTTRV